MCVYVLTKVLKIFVILQNHEFVTENTKTALLFPC